MLMALPLLQAVILVSALFAASTMSAHNSFEAGKLKVCLPSKSIVVLELL